MKINENSKKGEPKMNKMEKMQEEIKLLQRQMTNYACSNIKIGDKIYICGHKIVPDGYYFITNRDPTVVGVMPYSFKLNYGRGNWVNPQTCDVFKLITPEVTTDKPLTDYLNGPTNQVLIELIAEYPWIAKMIQGILKEIDWEYMGAVLAKKSDIEQVAFIKSFLKECKSWGTSHQVEMQFAHINDKLTDEEKDSLKMLSYTEGD